jgi:hypothetical protein
MLMIVGFMFRLPRSIFGCILVLFLAGVAFPKATSVVQISGVVTDPAGAAFPGAKVKATQADTGFSRIGRALLPGGAATWRELIMDRSVAAGDGRLALTALGETLRVGSRPRS